MKPRVPASSIFVLMLVLFAGLLSSAGVFAQEEPPAGLQGEVSYTVQVGDTLDGIGAFYDVKVECIIELNQIEDVLRIFPGDQIVLSDTCPRYGGYDIVSNPRENASPAFGLQTGPAGDGQGGGGEQIWVVGIGDTFDTIGQELNISSVAIQVANNWEPGDPLPVGAELIIPANAPAYGLVPALTEPPTAGQGGGGGPEGEVYVIQAGDTLDVLGATLNVQVDCILEANGISRTDILQPGTALLIPTDCPPYDGLSSP